MNHGPSNLIGGKWIEIKGADLQSRNPARPAEVVWSGSPKSQHVDEAVAAARKALPAWSALTRDKRFAVLRRFAALTKAGQSEMAGLLCDEVGKAIWESKGEAGLLAAKVDITLDAGPGGGLDRVTDFDLPLSVTRTGRCHFKPHGVMAVIGPYNFPAHLPNGHIVPALAMGNTVVFKPSDKAPAVGQLLTEWFDRAIREELGDGFGGVFNMVQGKADVAAALSRHPGLDAIAFTGSWAVARHISEANLDLPGRLLAFELGGNNPAIVLGDADLKTAALEITRCAFNTTGQRCTSTRRAIVHESIAGKLLPLIGKIASTLLIGDPRAGIAGKPVFMGPMVTDDARQRVLRFQRLAAKHGARVFMESTAMDVDGKGGFYLTPGILRVERFVADAPDRLEDEPGFNPGMDVEVFGPLLRVGIVKSLDEAIEQANATRYGLAASIFTKDEKAIQRFLGEVRAGCLNVNTGTAGASSKLPFGGLGLSGNHRPAGSFAADYCVRPVASMVETGAGSGLVEGMQFEDSWLN